jgi:hypothetical protein
MEARMRVGEPGGHLRNKVFTLHGHHWQRDPYVCPGSANHGLDGKCLFTDVPSKAIGHNPIGFYRGSQEGIGAGSHFDMVLESAGGPNAVPGDYLFTDEASFGNFAGSWGILRVTPSAASPAAAVAAVTQAVTPDGPQTTVRGIPFAGVAGARPVTEVSLLADVAGASITFTGAASGGSGKYEYQFWLYSGGSWSLVRDYSPEPGWTWDTTGVSIGDYFVEVLARNLGSPESYEAFADTGFVVQ